MKTSLFRCLPGLIVTLLCLPRVVFSAGVVNSATDAALRAAMTGGGTVTFNCEGTITVAGTLAVASSTVLDGTGHAITISGGNAVGLFSVNSGVSASFINLTLANGCVTGTDGVVGVNGQAGMGGAILNNGGTVALTGCTLASNNAVGGAGYTGSPPTAGGAGMGGAIYSHAGSLSVTNCCFVANRSAGGIGGASQLLGWAGGPGGAGCGGAIYTQDGNVTVQNSTFTRQTTQGGSGGNGTGYPAVPGQDGSAFGGAVWYSNIVAGCYSSTFTSNCAAGASAEGGAIFAPNGTAKCVGCTFITNTVSAGGFSGAVAQGGAIWCQASMSVSQSSFLGNQATGNGRAGIAPAAGEGSGGAIFNANAITLSASTFANNVAAGGYGGIRSGGFNQSGGPGRGGAICCLGTIFSTNCTLAANSATGGAASAYALGGSASGGNGTGGGIYNTGTATLVNLTLASNSASGGAGFNGGSAGSSAGGALCNSNGTVNLYNTIVAYSPSGSNCWGTMSDLGHNLSSDNSAGFSATGSLNNTDPVLGPLGNYGGPTLTLPLLAGSPAIDGGNTATAPATDQRGHARPYGAAADIGAFESSPPYFIGGRVSGQTLKDEVTVFVGSTGLLTTNLGSYGAAAFAPGTYTVTPTSPDYLFIPASRPISVGPDQFGLNFKAYHWNAISLEAATNHSMHCIIADSSGLTCRMLTSSNLFDWLPVSTNTVGPSNYFEVFLPVTGEPMRYYRTAIP